MSTGSIRVEIVNGRREAFDGPGRLLVTATDGQNKEVIRKFVDAGKPIELTDLKIHDNPDDRYTVLIAAKGHSDAGFNPVTVKPDQDNAPPLELMMLRRDAGFEFRTFDQISADAKLADLHALLCGTDADQGRQLYEDLARDAQRKPALACLLNITTALAHMTLVQAEGLTQNPLAALKALAAPPAQDRVFVWADKRLVKQVADTAVLKGVNGLSTFVSALAILHPGATHSFKQVDFGEGNVQFSFHPEEKSINGVECSKVELDIDYFENAAAHILLEVFPNKLKKLIHGKESSKALTDPRTVYGLRWIAGRRLGREFAPPYVLN